MDGSISLCLLPSRPGKGTLVISALFKCMGGSSIDDLGIRPPSLSECQSCIRRAK